MISSHFYRIDINPDGSHVWKYLVSQALGQSQNGQLEHVSASAEDYEILHMVADDIKQKREEKAKASK